MTHYEDELLAVPEARCGFIVIEIDLGEIRLGNGASEVLVRCNEDRGTEPDGVERGVVEGKDGGAAAADMTLTWSWTPGRKAALKLRKKAATEPPAPVPMTASLWGMMSTERLDAVPR